MPPSGQQIPSTVRQTSATVHSITTACTHWMAGAIYRTVDGIYRTVGVIYRTVDGIYRTVDGIYRTVDGIYRTVDGIYRTVGEIYRTVGEIYRTVDGIYCTVGAIWCTVAGGGRRRPGDRLPGGGEPAARRRSAGASLGRVGSDRGRWASGAWSVVVAGADLVVPVRCGGCGAHGSRWCTRCADILADDPVELSPRVDPGVPTWAMGRYRGVHRAAVLALKERGRDDLVAPLGDAVARGALDLARWSEIPADRPRLALIPAPTRRLSARRRGGDPVTAIARHAAARLGPSVDAHPILRTSMWARDSAGLSARDRVANLDESVVVHGPATRLDALRHERSAVLLLDDVMTTGATAAESVRVLAAAGVTVHAVLVVAAA